MKTSILEKFGMEKVLFLVIIIAVLVVAGIMFFIFSGHSSKNVELLGPLGKEEWEIGQSYKITWEAEGVERIGIVLFNKLEPEWIAEGIPAGQGEYEWRILPGHDYGPNFWIAVFEYPWRKGNKISYSISSFSITFPEMASCDAMSTQEEWPFLASDGPNIRKAFITEEKFNGDLDGFDGADEKCQIAAAEAGYTGEWTAFIGGGASDNTAIKRLEATPRALEGVFVDAEPEATLLRGATCHRILGKNFIDFLSKFSDLEILNKERVRKEFLSKMDEIWLGRVDENSIRTCLYIPTSYGSFGVDVYEQYSYSVSCQDWTYGGKMVSEYNRYKDPDENFPTCFTPAGEATYAVASGGLSSDLIKLKKEDEVKSYFLTDSGKYCSVKQRILCIQD